MIKLKLMAIIVLVSSLATTQTPDKLKRTEDEVRQEMIKISRQLGVTCTECHSTKNFKSDEKPGFKIALVHMKMVDMLKQQGLSGKGSEPEASCYTCHRGQLKFEYKEKLSDHYRSEPKKKTNQTKEQIIDDTSSED
ncbi:MAG: photosynthetic reaction center cytochrome c subunit [Bdellovibrionaceae bacterium]|nr:photosynthetic reaction center cytochrome c subunit [Pseudobdellovibrionaceae bacterium]